MVLLNFLMKNIESNLCKTDILYTDTPLDNQYIPATHPDMQLCKIGEDTFFTAPEYYKYYSEKLKGKKVICGIKSTGFKYPQSVAYNAAVIGDTIFCNLKYVDNAILDFCEDKKFKILHVSQGYTKCSMLFCGENAFITADNGIYETGRKNGFEVLKIREGNIELSGYNHGFIGGAGGYIENDTIAFFGNIKNHPDGKIISDFILSNGMKIINLYNGKLMDFGGAVLI